MRAPPRSTLGLLITGFLLYVPFVFFGHGANVDSIQVAANGRRLMATGEYTPSRYPGFPAHELPSALLDHLGGASLSNAGTVGMALLGLYAFIRLQRQLDVPHRALLPLLLLTNPVFWTTATYTIDYVWAVALLLVGFTLIRDRRFFLGAVAFGLAAAARATSVGFAGAVLAYEWARDPTARRPLLATALIVSVIGVLAYAPTFWRYGILHLYFGDWNTVDYLVNFVYGNLLFFGPQTVAVALIAAATGGARVGDLPRDWRLLIWMCLVLVVAYESLYLVAPLQVAYLLPLLPAVVLLAGIVWRMRPAILAACLIAGASSALLSINVLYVTGSVHQVESALSPIVAVFGPTVRGRTTTATLGFFVRWGYLVSDVAARRKTLEPPAISTADRSSGAVRRE
jgi:hypothetical protein